MKYLFWLVIVLGFGGMMTLSCGDDDGDDSPGESDGDADSDSDGDGDGDSETEEDSAPEECGGALEACCDGSCDDDLDPIENPIDGSCLCQAVCTFPACTAGEEEGECTDLFGALEDPACYNEIDFPPDYSSNECEVGEPCTTDSGESDGTCVALQDMEGNEVIRCVLSCSGEPEGCQEGVSVCTPRISMEGAIVVDYSDAHCSPAG